MINWTGSVEVACRFYGKPDGVWAEDMMIDGRTNCSLTAYPIKGVQNDYVPMQIIGVECKRPMYNGHKIQISTLEDENQILFPCYILLEKFKKVGYFHVDFRTKELTEKYITDPYLISSLIQRVCVSVIAKLDLEDEDVFFEGGCMSGISYGMPDSLPEDSTVFESLLCTGTHLPMRDEDLYHPKYMYTPWQL